MPVLSYDRLIENSEHDYYVSFDNVKVGELQAETLAKKLKEDSSASGPIVMINGDPADSNAALFKEGAHKGLELAGVDVAKEYDTPEWSAISNSMDLLALSSAVKFMVTGGVLLVAVLIDAIARKERQAAGRV